MTRLRIPSLPRWLTGYLSVAFGRVRRHSPSLLLAGTAAGLAYLLATFAFEAQDAFFAPIAAVVCAGILPGERIRRALEIAIGVAFGLAAADVLVRVIDSGPLQLGIAVFLVMTVAIALGSNTLLINQSAVAAVLVVALVPEQGGNPLFRFADALIGGGVALALSALLAPEPQRQIRHAAGDTLDRLLVVLRSITGALRETDLARAERAITQAREVEEPLEELEKGLDAARERAQLGRHRETTLSGPTLQLGERLSTLTDTMRSLARASANNVRHGEVVDPQLVESVRQLSAALREAQRWVDGERDGEAVRGAALKAAALASSLSETQPLAGQILIGQVRWGVFDLLHTTGMDREEAALLLEAMAGRADISAADSAESGIGTGRTDESDDENGKGRGRSRRDRRREENRDEDGGRDASGES